MTVEQIRHALKNGTPGHEIIRCLYLQGGQSLRATLTELDLSPRGTKNRLAWRIFNHARGLK